MDTRNKIVSATTAAAAACVTVVLGYFDPLTVAHVRRLEQLAGPVTVLLDSHAQPLLPIAARAELLAALSSVMHVVIAESDIPPQFAGRPVIDERSGDERRLRELMDHVLNRQNAG